MPIIFPVLRRLTVTGYELYQTNATQGIDHVFDKGVHVIAGINGLGKTTLLNIIYRSLVGPKDMSKEDNGLASTQHKLSDWRNKKYFRLRVRDSARNASMDAEISFGDRVLKVRRSLSTLEVQALFLDGEPEEIATQDRFEALTQELSGTSSYFDFFAMVRFLVFFLEDRPELIWDRRSQFDMFRLLFYDQDAARESAAVYDSVQRLDSQFRNERVPIRKARDELAEYDAAEQSGIASEIRAGRRAVIAAQDADAEFANAIEDARSHYESCRLRREKSRLDLEEARRAHEHEQELFYQHVFPDLAETAEHVFLNLAAGGGCLVCGNKSAAAGDRLREFAARHQCPICESTVEQQENVISSATFNQKRLDKAAAQVKALRDELEQLDEELGSADHDLRGHIAARQESLETLQRLQRALMQLQRQATPEVLEAMVTDDDQAIAYKRKYVEQGEIRLASLLASRTTSEVEYRRLKDSQRDRLSEKLAQVKKSFARIAERLLAEKCLLREANDTRKIGQEGELFDFPILEVMMSSAVFTGSPSAREDSTAVSESQREFIDLAFRMALIEAASGTEIPSMLVIETPEASLDSLFVREAGALFRSYAAMGGENGNVFIASTNLNDENMIPALFGAEPPPEPDVVDEDDETVLERSPSLATGEPSAPILPVGQRSAHVINLLSLSSPNAALRAHRPYYERKLRDAVFKDVPVEERPSGKIGLSAQAVHEGGAVTS